MKRAGQTLQLRVDHLSDLQLDQMDAVKDALMAFRKQTLQHTKISIWGDYPLKEFANHGLITLGFGDVDLEQKLEALKIPNCENIELRELVKRIERLHDLKIEFETRRVRIYKCDE